MTTGYLQFDERYAALFWTHVADGLERLEPLSEDSRVSVSLYDSPGLTLSVVVGDQHPEGVMTWLQRAHDAIGGSSLIAGIVGGSRMPPGTDCYLFRAPLNALSESALRLILADDAAFFLFRADKSEIYLLVSSTQGLNLLRRLPRLSTPVTGLVPRKLSSRPPLLKRSSQPYDPIAAQIGEVMKSSNVALKQQLKELRRTWHQRVSQDAPVELLSAEAELDKLIRDVTETQNAVLSTEEGDGRFLSLFDMAAGWINLMSEMSARLISQLTDYDEPPDPWKSLVCFSETIPRLVLVAARRFCRELLERSNLLNQFDILPVFGENFMITAKMFPPIGLSAEAKPGKGTLIVCVPRQLRFRLGAMPVLAHEVAHIIARQDVELIRAVATGDKRFGSATLRDVFEQLALPEAPMGYDEERDYLETLPTAFRWAEEILSDLVAASLCGPAYLYSISRFAIGTLSQLEGRGRPSETHPPFSKRLALCIGLLESTGFEVPFRSRYLRLRHESLAPDLCHRIVSLVRTPYLAPEHSTAVNEVKAHLLAGKTVEASPVQVFNALWDAVVRKHGYVNEIAMALSLKGI